jgi:hypothetical protein
MKHIISIFAFSLVLFSTYSQKCRGLVLKGGADHGA